MSTAKQTGRYVLLMSLSLAVLASVPACMAQGDNNTGKGPGGGPGNGPAALQNQGPGGQQDIIGMRLNRQRRLIKRALKTGAMTDDQAAKLNANLAEIEGQVQQLRSQNNGVLKEEDFRQIDNSLNQSQHEIRSFVGAGKRSVQGGDVLGAQWKQGKDGAQNPRALLQEMKKENLRELRQERQTNAQKIEQQQLQYEKEMVDKLGQQREDILKQKDELKDVRKESGAD